MNKDSFDKIINLDVNDIKINDFKQALFFFLELKDENLKKIFLDNYKKAISIFFKKNSLDTKINLPVYGITNIDAYNIGKLSFYMYALYGEKELSSQANKMYYDGYNRFKERFFVLTKKMYKEDLSLNLALKLYRKEQDIKENPNNFDEDIIKEAYYTYFTIDDYYDKYNHSKRVKSFLKKHNIDLSILRDYIRAYGILYLNLSIKNIDNKISSLATAISSVPDSDKYEEIIKELLKIKDSNNLEEIENIIISKNITVDIIIYLYKKRYLDINIYKKVKTKVNRATEILDKNYKYTNYSVAISRLEKENDFTTILTIVLNNNKYLYSKNIRNFISTYRNNLTPEEQNNLYLDLRLKLIFARNVIAYQKIIKNKIEKLEAIKKTIEKIDFTLLLDDNITTIKQFCDIVGITKSQYYQYINVIKDTNVSLYQQIQDKMQNRSNTIIQEGSVISIADQIKIGIKDDNGNIRKFELLDYFLSTKLSYSEFYKIYSNSKEKNLRTIIAIESFFKHNKLIDYKDIDYYNMINIDQELDGTTIFMKNNEPYEVTREEKEDVINFLQEKGIPLYTKVYKQALRRHVHGCLILESEKKKTLIKN